MMIKDLAKLLLPKYPKPFFLDYHADMAPRYGHGKPAHPFLYELLNKERNEYKEHLTYILSLKERLWTIKSSKLEQDNTLAAWNNGFLPGLDMISIYSMLSYFKPNKYVEVGSGNSTKVAFKAKQDQNLQTNIISIDPQPRAEIDNLSNEIIRKPFENLDFSIAEILGPGDILFIDNSHRILPNSDSTVFYLETLPFLKKGVIVHIHDVYLPYDYPQFMCDRFYSEQYGLAMFLLANPEKFKPILPNYFISEDKELSEFISPIWNHENLKGVEVHGGSFWLEIQG